MAILIRALLLLYRKKMFKCCVIALLEREQDIEPKVSVKFTFAHVILPKVDNNYEMIAWCPRTIKEREDRSFNFEDHEDSA